MNKTPNNKKRYFFNLISLPIILSIIGLIFIFESSSVMCFSKFNDSFYYLKLQVIRMLIGIVLMVFLSIFDYHKLYYVAFTLMLVTIIMLAIVLIPSVGQMANGARSWLDIGFFSLQPTELAKLSCIIYLSSWFISKERKKFFSFLIFLGILMFLIILQPDMGTALMVFFLSVIIYFIAGIDLHYLLIFIPVSAFGFYLLIKMVPYRFNRLLAFFDPSRDPLGITYHINQILISLSNGGLFGTGLGVSRQKYMFLPEAHTDSIFAIIGEEFGFIGGFALIVAFVLLIITIYKISVNAPDRFGKLLAGGIFAFFNLQVIVNLAGMVNLIPLTGVPLPFISYGGSNLLISFAMIGILMNISRRIKKA